MDQDQFSEDDINLATQLSLLDLAQNEETPVGDEEEDDELIAIAIQESLHYSSQQHGGRASSSSHPSVIDCDVCNTVFSAGMRYGRIEFWNQYYCWDHTRDGTPTCCSCFRFKSSDVEYMDLGDNRRICPDCYPSSIKHSEQLEPLTKSVLKFFKKKGLNIHLQIPIYLVTRAEMSYHTRGGTSTGPVHPDSIIWGLTMHSPFPHGATIQHVTSSQLRGMQIHVEQTCSELASLIRILILFGLPMVVTGAILAHETMHAWFRLQGVPSMEPKVEEGICQVIGHEWLDWFELSDDSTSEGDQFVRNLKETVKHQVEINCSPAYGEGFREAKHSVGKHGLRYVVQYITRYGTLPD